MATATRPIRAPHLAGSGRRLDRRRRMRVAAAVAAEPEQPKVDYVGSPRERWLEQTALERRKEELKVRQQNHIKETRERQKATRPGVEWPWSLPCGLRPTDDMTPQDLQDEARAQRPLLKRMGFRDSAMRHPHLIKVQYLRAAGFLGWLGIKPYFVAIAWILFGTVAMGGFFWFLGTQAFSLDGGQACAEGVTCVSEQAQRDAAFVKWGAIIVGLVMGAGISMVGAVLALAFTRFATAYAETTIVQAHYRDEARKAGREVVALTEIPLLRLATVTDQENRYIGEEGKNSFGKGRSLLETGLNISKITDIKVFYDAVAHRSTWTGRFASSTHSWYNLAGQAGRLDRMLKNKRKDKKFKLDPIGNYGLMILLVSVVVALLMIMTGFDSHSYLKENLPY